MPTPRKYATNAARQAAYRQRGAASPATSLPAPPATPGTRRWRTLLGHARTLLATVATEMTMYGEKRSNAWQESERGETFTERMETVEAILDLLEELRPETKRR